MDVSSTALKVQDNIDVLSYWLSNSSTLLSLLQRTLKATGAASLTPQRRRSTSTSLFGRMSQVRKETFFFCKLERDILSFVVSCSFDVLFFFMFPSSFFFFLQCQR